MADAHGIVLAAGAGRRFGGPKALARDASGTPWIELAVAMLTSAGCHGVTVVLGADAERARALVPPEAGIVTAAHWQFGMSASLRAGLAAAAQTEAAAALVTLVDLPGLPVEVARRVLGREVSGRILRQAVFGGRPGHPVLLGRDHFAELVAGLEGDRGARGYLVEHGAEEVECGDLADGLDVDVPTGSTPSSAAPADDTA
ncbi:nucleotidyltransferase family protein [Frondihabitans peucedani]|uniref:Nucleotidyltransferase family protein n=1 Tax=Frondihabitans peucedani TaxID=598626 RepID=A0ABP8E5L4_9MICO